jgi:hypothetical protein
LEVFAPAPQTPCCTGLKAEYTIFLAGLLNGSILNTKTAAIATIAIVYELKR